MVDNTFSNPLPVRWAPRFFTIWGAQALSLFGSSLVQFALVWWLTEKTGSATVLATASLFGMLPQVILGPIAGTFVDRTSRRVVMMAADGVIAFATLILAFLFWTGHAETWHVYAILVIRSAGGAFHWPAMQASTSLMVPKEQLARIAGMNQTLNGLVTIVAPPTGALLIGLMPTAGVLAIDVVTAIIAILPLVFIAVPNPPKIATTEKGAPSVSFTSDLAAGVHYLVSWPGLLAICLMAMAINFLLNPAGSLMPLLVTKHFGQGAVQFGLLDSLWGIGMIVGGVILSVWGGFKRKVVTSLTGIIGLGIGILVVGIAPANMFWMAIAGNFFVGMMNPITNGPLFAILQSTVRPDMQGRVMSLINTAALAISPISLLVAGPIADAFSIQVWFVIGGIVCGLMGVGAFFVPAIMNVENNHREHKDDDTPALAASVAD